MALRKKEGKTSIKMRKVRHNPLHNLFIAQNNNEHRSSYIIWQPTSRSSCVSMKPNCWDVGQVQTPVRRSWYLGQPSREGCTNKLNPRMPASCGAHSLWAAGWHLHMYYFGTWLEKDLLHMPATCLNNLDVKFHTSSTNAILFNDIFWVRI